MLMITERSVAGYVAFLQVFEVDNCKAFYSFKEETREVAQVLRHKEAISRGQTQKQRTF